MGATLLSTVLFYIQDEFGITHVVILSNLTATGKFKFSLPIYYAIPVEIDVTVLPQNIKFFDHFFAQSTIIGWRSNNKPFYKSYSFPQDGLHQ